MFPKFQSAYRQYRSTETALIKVVNDIIRALDTGDVALLTLLDLSSAFDTVDHDIVLNRLEISFGIVSNTQMDAIITDFTDSNCQSWWSSV